MTIWRVGMLAVCVDASVHHRNGPRPQLDVGKVYRIASVEIGDCPCHGPSTLGLKLLGVKCRYNSGFAAERFRPLIDEPDNTVLIARIKACKPAHQPVLDTRGHEEWR